jgi:hypothetical protein
MFIYIDINFELIENWRLYNLEFECLSDDELIPPYLGLTLMKDFSQFSSRLSVC